MRSGFQTGFDNHQRKLVIRGICGNEDVVGAPIQNLSLFQRRILEALRLTRICRHFFKEEWLTRGFPLASQEGEQASCSWPGQERWWRKVDLWVQIVTLSSYHMTLAHVRVFHSQRDLILHLSRINGTKKKVPESKKSDYINAASLKVPARALPLRMSPIMFVCTAGD